MPDNNERNKTSPAVPRRSWMTILLILAASYVLVRLLFPSLGAPKIPYTALKEQGFHRNVAEVFARGVTVNGTFDAAIVRPTAAHRASSSPVYSSQTSLGGSVYSARAAKAPHYRRRRIAPSRVVSGS